MAELTKNEMYGPEKEIRRDLWHDMTLSQLKNQQDMLLNKMGLMASMLGPASPPHVQQLYTALQGAYQQLLTIIDSKSKR